MADFGIVTGTLSLAGVFTACVDCFEYIQFARHFDRDFDTQVLSLGCARLRLTRWGQAVNVLEDPNLGRPNASIRELETAKRTLEHILGLFGNSAKVAGNYQAAGNLIDLQHDQPQSPPLEVSRRMRDVVAKRRAKGPSILKKMRWALHDRSQLGTLTRDITVHIENLEKLFPAPQSQQIVEEEMAQLEIRDSQELMYIQAAAQDIDPLLQATAKEARGHDFSGVTHNGRGGVGDSFSKDWKRGSIGRSHEYSGVNVGEKGRVIVGNRYGGKDVFDD